MVIRRHLVYLYRHLTLVPGSRFLFVIIRHILNGGNPPRHRLHRRIVLHPVGKQIADVHRPAVRVLEFQVLVIRSRVPQNIDQLLLEHGISFVAADGIFELDPTVGTVIGHSNFFLRRSLFSHRL